MRTATLLLFAAEHCLMACGSAGANSADAGSDASNVDATVQDAGDFTCPNELFAEPFVPHESITAIVPLGQVAPSAGHVLPTDHIYIYGLAADTTLIAPGDLRITGLTLTEPASGQDFPPDAAIAFELCGGTVTGRFGHVRSLSAALSQALEASEATCDTYSPTGGSEDLIRVCSATVSIAASAGTNLGTVMGTFDFNLYDGRVTHAFANPERYAASQVPNVVCALDYFETDLRSAYSALLGNYDGSILRTVEPRCGEVAQDVVGTAAGTWFSTDHASIYEENSHVSLVHDNVDPTRSVFSIGSTALSAGGPIRAEFEPAFDGSRDRAFEAVMSGSGVHCYAPDIGSWILLEVAANGDELTLEAITAAGPCPSAPTFSSGARTFVR